MIKKILANNKTLKLPSIVIAFFLAILISCDGGSSSGEGSDGVMFDGDYPVQNSKNWTVMIYLDGDNDLESAAVKDFNEMEYGLHLAKQLDANIEDKLNIVVLYDRHPDYSSSDGNWADTRLYKVSPDSSMNYASVSTPIAKGVELNMGHPDTLEQFVTWSQEKFPADKYALILWNHGSGARSSSLDEPLVVKDRSLTKSLDKPLIIGSAQKGVKAICDDETDEDILYLDEVQQALIAAGISYSNKIDIIGFDACLMGSVEVAYEFRDLAYYMVGSMNLEWGDGWDYTRLISEIPNNISSSEELAKLMVKQYRDSTLHVSSETQSAIDLSKITALKTAVDAFAVKLADENKKSEIETTRDSSCNFYTSDIDSISYPYYDLGDFACKISADTGYSADLRNSAEVVITKLSEAVVSAYANTGFGNYYGTGNDVKRGLSIFFSRGNLTYDGHSHYAYQWWYSSRNTVTSYGAAFEYGRIDFCNFNSNGIVETWKELLEYFYNNPSGTASADTF